MKIFVKIVALFFMLFPFSACFRKKAAIGNLQDWLDAHYPGRFQVLYTGSDDAIRHLSFKVKKSLVAETGHPLVQAQLKWDKRQPDLGLATATVDAAFAQAKISHEAAQSLSKLLKERGFKNRAVGVRNAMATVLLFEPATPENRKALLSKMENVWKNWPMSGDYDKKILLMDTAKQATIPGDILPLSYFLDRNGRYLQDVVYSFDQGLALDNPLEAWQFNTQNDQFSAAYDQAKSALEEWAKANVKQPYFLMAQTEYEEISQTPLRFRFKFEFTYADHSKAAADGHYIEPDGYFSVDFDLEKNAALKITMSDGPDANDK